MKIPGWLLSITLVAVIAAMGMIVLMNIQAMAQSPPASTYQPTEVQSLRLQVAQRDAQLAQRDVVAANQRFQAAVAALSTAGERVKQENKWPDDVHFDLDTLNFSQAPAKEPAKKEPTK
jgi:hypothetical protein